MDVGRHAGHAVGVSGVVAPSGVAVEPLVLERLPAGEGGLLPALESPNGVNGGVDVALLKQGPALVEVGQLMFDHDGFKRQVAVVGFHLVVHLRPAALKALLAQFLGPVSELEGTVDRASVERHGDDAMAVNFDNRAFGQVGHGLHPIGPGWEREQVGDDHARPLSQFLHRRRAMTGSSEVKHVAKALLAETSVQVNGCVHDHVVMAQRGVRVAFVQSVVDQQRAAVVVSHPSSDVDNRVLMHAKQRLEPDHDGTITNRCSCFAEPPASLTEMLWQIHAVGLMRWLI